MNDVVTKHSHLEKIKAHFRRNKKIYIGVGIGVAGLAVGFGTGFGIARYLGAKKLAAVAASSAALVSNSTTVNGSNNVVKNVTKITNHVQRLAYNSMVLWPDGTEKWFKKQGEAARYLGISPSRLSRHINHGDPLEGGIKVFRVGVALST